MRILISVISFIFYVAALHAQSTWKPKELTLPTRWSPQVHPGNALKEYPRPQMIRNQWINLNGLWDYSIADAATASMPPAEGQILVPYPIESALSGVKRALLPEQRIWYKRTFACPSFNGTERLLLHFGAVDYQCWIYVNGKEVGSHEGGYTAFGFDITSYVKPGNNELVVKVYDPSDAGVGPRGKQVLHPANIYYTPSSGIWQTVWLETVPQDHIEGLVMTPDIDKGVVNLTVKAQRKSLLSVTVAGKTVKGSSNEVIVVPVAHARLWSPADPYLYDMEITLGRDKVKSYFGMRKVEIKKSSDGYDRIFLNNQPYFNLGTLDQGFWPDGLHTAPTDEALKFDIEVIKAMGFNTIRKHIKIEPARWYYHADKIGILVWQDFVQPDFALKPGSKEIFEKQGAAMLAQLHNYPSISTWVLFNEKWGQYDQERLTRWVKNTDPSRIVNGHSGEYLYVNDKLRSPSPNAYVNADITDVHSYPEPMNAIQMPGKARVLGEFGGIGVFVPDHQWNTDAAWGYVNTKPAELMAKYAGMNQKLEALEKEGLSGSIYTQPFDVEGEQNGLLTYDREVIKIPFDQLRKIHTALNQDLKSGKMYKAPAIEALVRNADLTDPEILYSRAVESFKAGNRDVKTIRTIIGGVSSIKSQGFELMVKNQGIFRKEMGAVNYSSKMTEIIFKEAIQPMFQQQKTWEQIGEKMTEDFGAAGEETYLRIRTLGAMNANNTEELRKIGSLYLEKYGSNIATAEKTKLEKHIR